MKKIINEKIWEKEFNRIKDKEEFIDYYCDIEDKWLQYSDWDEKIKALFGNYKNAVLSFYKSQVEATLS